MELRRDRLIRAAGAPASSPDVLHVVDSLRLGGAEKSALELVARQHGRGSRVVVIAGPAPRGATLEPGAVPLEQLELRPVDGTLGFRYARHVLRALRRHRPALVHGHMFTGSVAAIVAARLCRIPVVVTDYSDLDGRRIAERIVARLVYPFAHRLIAISPSSQAAYARRRFFPKQRVRTVMLAVLSDQGLRDRPAGLRAGATTRHIGVIGRLDRKKGISYFLRSIEAVVQEAPRISFFIVGQGPAEEALRREAEELGITERVTFVGACPSLPQIMWNLDVLVVPSLTEGGPRIVLEAMEAALPVVATNVGNIPHQLEGVGVIVPPGDAASLARAIVDVLSDPIGAELVGRQARERFATVFDYDDMVAETWSVYEEVVGSRGFDTARSQETRRFAGV